MPGPSPSGPQTLPQTQTDAEAKGGLFLIQSTLPIVDKDSTMLTASQSARPNFPNSRWIAGRLKFVSGYLGFWIVSGVMGFGPPIECLGADHNFNPRTSRDP